MNHTLGEYKIFWNPKYNQNGCVIYNRIAYAYIWILNSRRRLMKFIIHFYYAPKILYFNDFVALFLSLNNPKVGDEFYS